MAGNSDGAAKRGPGRPFQPGESGNPAGRPKVAEEFRARARRATDEMVFNAWEEEVRDRGSSWLRASELLAAYGYGKPSTLTDEDDGAVTRPFAGLTTEQLLESVRGLRERRGA